jgi:hypothetical protein
VEEQDAFKDCQDIVAELYVNQDPSIYYDDDPEEFAAGTLRKLIACCSNITHYRNASEATMRAPVDELVKWIWERQRQFDVEWVELIYSIGWFLNSISQAGEHHRSSHFLPRLFQLSHC